MRRFEILLVVVTLLLVSCAANPTLRLAPGPTAVATRPPVAMVAAAEPAAPPKNLVVCMPSEPRDLLWMNESLPSRTILDALVTPLISQNDYNYQPYLIEQIPSFADGSASLRMVSLSEGDVFFDLISQRPVILSVSLTQPFMIYQENAPPLYVERWDGYPIKTMQTVVRWRLIPNLRWQDGTPVTAHDSLYAFELNLDPAWPGDTTRMERTQSYTALDDRTMQWKGIPGYIENTYFLNLWTPVPRHLYEGQSLEEVLSNPDIKRRPFSYGPYQVVEWERGDYIRLIANPYYVKGAPAISEITFKFNADPDAVLDALLAGDCDIATQNPSFERAYHRTQELVSQGRLRSQQVAGDVFEHLDFNLNPAPDYTGAAATLRDAEGGLLFQNPQFRYAIAACLDRQRLVDENANGAAVVNDSYMSTDHLLHPGDTALTLHPFNPMYGRSLLEQLGWRDTDGDLILDNGAGQSLTLRYLLRRDPSRVSLARLIRDQLALQCGIKLVLEYRGAEFFDDGPRGVIFGRSYDLAEFGWLSGTEPPCYLYISTEIPNESNGWGASNNVGFSNPDFDAACTSALSTLDQRQKAADHARALTIFTQQLPSIPLFTRTVSVIYRPEITGISLNPTATSELWNIGTFDIR